MQCPRALKPRVKNDAFAHFSGQQTRLYVGCPWLQQNVNFMSTGIFSNFLLKYCVCVHAPHTPTCLASFSQRSTCETHPGHSMHVGTIRPRCCNVSHRVGPPYSTHPGTWDGLLIWFTRLIPVTNILAHAFGEHAEPFLPCT